MRPRLFKIAQSGHTGRVSNILPLHPAVAAISVVYLFIIPYPTVVVLIRVTSAYGPSPQPSRMQVSNIGTVLQP